MTRRGKSTIVDVRKGVWVDDGEGGGKWREAGGGKWREEGRC